MKPSLTSKQRMRRAFVVEGPDGCGKSVFATELARRRGAILTRHGPYPSDGNRVWLRYLAALLPPYAGIADAVLDRSWLSEPIYGAAYRDGANRIAPWQRRMLERVALGRGLTTVLCRVPWETCKTNFTRRAAEGGEYLESTEQLRKVYDGYKALSYRKAYGSSEVVGRATVYDFTSSTNALEATLGAIATADENYGPGIGAWVPRVSSLLIGERPAGFGGRWHLPFVSANPAGCSAWLATALEEAGVSETRLYWVNADDGAGQWLDPAFVKQLAPKRIIALGDFAAGWCEEEGVTDFVTVPHPQKHKRFHHRDPYQLIEELKK